MSLPSIIRVHQIVDYYYCSERSRLNVLYGLENPVTGELECGSLVHQWLEQRPKTRGELVLLEALKPYYPYTRTFNGFQIIGHPDDLTLLKKTRVQVVEYKTVDSQSLKQWKTCLARFQTQIYAWILEPILTQIGYSLAHNHKVVYLSRSGVFLKKLGVEHDPHCVERKITEILGFWETGEPLIKPFKWKCRLCPEVFKERCRVHEQL